MTDRLPEARHIARWDLDKTYLQTEFDTLRDLLKTAFERADEKRTTPGASTLIREMVHAGSAVHILSGSPEQMRRRLEAKLRLDGVSWDSFTLKPNLRNLFRFRFRAIRDQLGYKLPALLQARAEESRLHGASRLETLFGDDAEADAFVYALYADIVAGRVGEELLIQVCERGRMYTDDIASVLRYARMIEPADIVERVLIHLDRQVPPDKFYAYGPRLVPFYNYLQAALVLYEDGRLPARAVLRVAVELVVQHHFDADALARSYLELVRRGHMQGFGLEGLRDELRIWASQERVTQYEELEGMLTRLTPTALERASLNRRQELGEPPAYQELVRRQERRKKGFQR